VSIDRYADLPFPARITETVTTDEEQPRDLYGFAEQALLPSGDYADAPGGRTGRCGLADGTGRRQPALGFAGATAAAGELVRMRLRGMHAGEPLFEFDAAGGQGGMCPLTFVSDVCQVETPIYGTGGQSGTVVGWQKTLRVQYTEMDETCAVVDKYCVDDPLDCCGPVAICDTTPDGLEVGPSLHVSVVHRVGCSCVAGWSAALGHVGEVLAPHGQQSHWWHRTKAPFGNCPATAPGTRLALDIDVWITAAPLTVCQSTIRYTLYDGTTSCWTQQHALGFVSYSPLELTAPAPLSSSTCPGCGAATGADFDWVVTE
jgi:hypothetical protein